MLTSGFLTSCREVPLRNMDSRPFPAHFSHLRRCLSLVGNRVVIDIVNIFCICRAGADYPSNITPAPIPLLSHDSAITPPSPSVMSAFFGDHLGSMTVVTEKDLVPIKVFVHEVLRRSRTTCSVLQSALCYIKAIRSTVPDIAQLEQEGEARLFNGRQDRGCGSVCRFASNKRLSERNDAYRDCRP